MAIVGLKFDLEPWKKGVRNAGALVKKGISGSLLRPFDAAVKRTAAGMATAFKTAGAAIKSALASAFFPLLALFGVAKVISEIKKALTGSLQAYRDYSDSVTTLQASLKTLGEAVNLSFATREVKALGEQLRLALGITGAEVNRAFGDFVTRGFDFSQARQLTILAGNYAKKTGKPLLDVTKQIADAANGNLRSLKELGVQIAITGDRVRDGEAAVLALKSAYGDIGSELANPSERLAAAWNLLGVTLGEKISPIIEPLVQGFSDFVVGLTKTEEGQQMLEKVAEAIRFVVEFLKQATTSVSNLVEMIRSGGSVIVGLLKSYINEAMKFWLDSLRSLPGGDWLLERLGLDGKAMSAAFREQSQAALEEVKAASSDFVRAQGEFLRGESDTGIAGQFNSLMEAGRREREAAARALREEIEATAGQTFAGRPAQEMEAARAAKAREVGTKRSASRATGRASAEDGQRVSVRIVSTRPDRFRKARFA
jgi:hypothetical protein